MTTTTAAMNTSETITSAVYPGFLTTDRQFKVAGGDAVYMIRALTPQTADDLGCPGATHILVSPNTRTHIVGTLTVTTGRRVRIPGRGWSNRAGVHGRFTPWGQPTETLPGHVTVI